MTPAQKQKGEYVRREGITNVLKEMGYIENTDFIFLRSSNPEPYIFGSDGEYSALWLVPGKKETVNYAGKNIDNVITEYDLMHSFAIDNKKSGALKYGITSNNNGVAAIYIPNEGMIITPDYDLMRNAENSLLFEHTGMGVPLSNGEKLENKMLQKNWESVKQHYENHRKTITMINGLEKLQSKAQTSIAKNMMTNKIENDL